MTVNKLVVASCVGLVLFLSSGARADTDLALGKPASQSSLSQWSVPTGAQGGVDGVKNGSFGFHTGLETNPWWQVDLGAVRSLDRVVVFNRQDCCAERSRTIHVLLSDDGRSFRDVYTHDGTVFGGAWDGRPLVVGLHGVRARFVRLRLVATDYLHLDEVEVYSSGSEQPSAGKAPGMAVVPTICANGQLPVASHSGCWCGDDSIPITSRTMAPYPDPSCRPTERVEGPYCLWSCGHPTDSVKPKSSALVCRNGLGKPVACISEDDFACALDDYAWKPPPGGSCDSPPGPADRVYRSPGPAGIPTAPQTLTQAATFVPPPTVGEIYLAVDYKQQGGRPVATNIAATWGSWKQHAVATPVPGARGFVLTLSHSVADTVPLFVATDGAIVSGPMQSARLRLAGYAEIRW
jgi:hypothetical protein